MSAVDEREVVGTILGSWTTCPIAWPNRDFEPPADKKWIAVTIRQGDAFQLEIGGPKKVHRHPGVLFIQVFGPSHKGDKATLEIADEVADLFRRATGDFTDGSVQFLSPSIRAVGVDGGCYQVNVTVPFRRDVLY